MQSFPPAQPSGIKLPGPGVTIILLVILILLAYLSWMLAEKIAPAIFPPVWKSDIERAEKLTDKDPATACALYLKAIKEAELSHTAPLNVAEIYSKLGTLYIGQDNRQAGEKCFDDAIAVAETAKRYDKAAEFCQDASWAEHCQYWKSPNWLPNIGYQKKAVTAETKASGEKSSQYYLWTLGQIYLDLGDLQKAQECLNKASHTLTQLDGKLTAYDYGCMSRLYAMQHKWNKSLDAFLKARAIATEEKENIKLTDNGFEKYLDDANPEKSKYDFAIVPKLLQEKDFDKLENMANTLGSQPEIMPDGYWQQDKFYEAIHYLQDSDSKERWQKYLSTLSTWVEQKPQSVTARVALANAYVRYAWKARDSRKAEETVNDDDWKAMAERLKKAEALIREAQKLPDKCPYLYLVLANVALGQQWSRTDYEKLVAECHQQFPNYLPIYMSKAYYLQPRWNGTSAEWEDFVAKLADKTGGTDGDIIYAQIIWDINNLDLFDNIFSDNSILDWQRTKRGLLALIKRYPHDATVRKELILLALQADDEKAVHQAFTTPL